MPDLDGRASRAITRWPPAVHPNPLITQPGHEEGAAVSTAPLFLLDPLPTAGPARLEGPEGRHAATVRRLRRGEAVLLSDGRGGLARAVVDAAGRDTVDLTIIERVDVDPPSPRVVVAQALVKGDRGELAVELATEAGVDAIVRWRAGRCVARWD